MTDNIHIIILDKKEPDACCAGCGLDWSAPSNLLLAEERVKSRFNRAADAIYYDVTGGVPRGLDQFKDRVMPSLIINGHLRISGQFDMRMLLEAVDTEIEISRVGGR